MRRNSVNGVLVLAASIVAMSAIPAPAQTDTPDLGNVRSTSGCPDDNPQQFYPCAVEKAKRAKPPRTADGKPDFQGLWGRNGRLLATNLTLPGNSPVVDPAETIPYQPWAEAKKKELQAQYIDSVSRCMPHGVPRHFLAPEAYQIIQTPGYIAFLAEQAHITRIVPLDGRPHVGPKSRSWMGDAVGHWEGNTLVIDTTNLNGLAVFAITMDFASDALHVVERYTMLDANNIFLEVTMEDPTVFTRPWKMAWGRTRDPREATGAELLEEACYEGNGRWMNGEIAAGRRVLSAPVRRP